MQFKTQKVIIHFAEKVSTFPFCTCKGLFALEQVHYIRSFKSEAIFITEAENKHINGNQPNKRTGDMRCISP